MTDETLVLLKPFELEAMLKRAVEAALKAHGGVETSELLTTAELAGVLKMSDDTVRLWVRAEDCPHVRAGKKKLRFRLRDVVAWLEQRDFA